MQQQTTSLAELSDCFNSEAFNVERIREELYDFSKPGLVCIPGFLKMEMVRKVLDEILINERLFVTSPESYGKARQNFSSFYIGEADTGYNKVEEDLPVVRELHKKYSKFYRKLAKAASFACGRINSIGIHRYTAGEVGIEPHLDNSWYANLVSIFVLKGMGRFSVYPEGKQAIHGYPRAGSLVLMRQPRNDYEVVYRPRHSIDKISEERFSILFRQNLFFQRR